jgi:hypothetical protein
MASNFHIQKPYVFSNLPSPAKRSESAAPKFSVGEVFGLRLGSKKRKRTELSVGIDYDAVNLYDVRSYLC